MISDLFTYAAAADGLSAIKASPEHAWLTSIALGHFRPRPTEPVWQWADREVWLDPKMSASAGRYQSKRTPWAREIQDLPRNPGVRQCAVMKSSRTGITEACLNVLRWMPDHWPGNALYAINNMNLGRQVAKRRIIPGLEQAARGQLTDDPNDRSLSTIALKNMDVVISGSGSAGPFMEMWYRLIILDELENHQQGQETTTEERAASRQTDVDDGITYMISKPEMAGGIIDIAYIRGTQKRYRVPCPRCGIGSEGNAGLGLILDRHGVVYKHCQNTDGTWDLDRVVKDSYRVCPHCKGRIDEHEKAAMVDAGIWVPTEYAERRRPPDGRFVPPEPGVESYQISDWYSLHARATTGEMMKAWLMRNEIAVTESGKKYFCVNHDGWPWEVTTYKLTDSSIDALKGGRVEQREITKVDGTKETVSQVLGCKFHLAYVNGEFRSRLPFRPALISVHADKQQDVIKALIYAWMNNGERYLIEIAYYQDEDAMFDTLAVQRFWIDKAHLENPDEDEPMFCYCGRIDSGNRPTEVYRACMRGYRRYGMQVWPARGEGSSNKTAGKKLFRTSVEPIDGEQLTVRVFWDHELKNNFYLSRIQERMEPRMWLPDDLPEAVYKEWTSESYSESEGKWIHNKARGPNDFGDCGKSSELFFLEEAEGLKGLPCSYPVPSATVAPAAA